MTTSRNSSPSRRPDGRPQSSNSRNCFGEFSRCLAAHVNEKEKRGKSGEKQCSAKHPHLIRKNGSDLLRREKSQGDSQSGSDKPAGAGKNQCDPAIASFSKGIAERDSQQRPEHIKKGNQLQNHSERKQLLKSFLHTGFARR